MFLIRKFRVTFCQDKQDKKRKVENQIKSNYKKSAFRVVILCNLEKQLAFSLHGQNIFLLATRKFVHLIE